MNQTISMYERFRTSGCHGCLRILTLPFRPQKATSCKSQADALKLLLSSKHFLVEKFQIVKHTWRWIGNSCWLSCWRAQLKRWNPHLWLKLCQRWPLSFTTSSWVLDQCGYCGFSKSKTTTSLCGTSIGTPTKIAPPISNGYTCVWHFFSWKSSSSIPSWCYMDHHQQQHKKEREEEEEEEQEKRSKLMGHVRCQF